MGSVAASVASFYARHARLVVAALVVAGAAGWAGFLFVSQAVGVALITATALAALPFLWSGPTPHYPTTADPANTVGVTSGDLDSGPFLGGDS